MNTPTRSYGFFFTLHIILLLSAISAILLTFDAVTTVIPSLWSLFPTFIPIGGGNLLLLIPANIILGILALTFGVIGKRKTDSNQSESLYVSWTLGIGIYSLIFAVAIIIFFVSVFSGFRNQGF
jgi:hypothetical protein